MKDFADKFGKLPIWQKLVFLLFIWGAGFAGYYYLVFQEQEEKIKGLDTQIRQQTSERNQLRIKVEEKAKFEKRLQELEDQRKKALTFLPDDPQTDELTIEFNRRAKQSQIRIVKLAQKSEASMGFYAKVPLLLTLEGTFHQLVIFFNLISEMKRIVNISDVKFSDPLRRDGQVYLKAEALATCYRSLKESSAPKKAAKTPSANAASFKRGKDALKGRGRGKGKME
jgi:type IV pilus assembly protein PilO